MILLGKNHNRKLFIFLITAVFIVSAFVYFTFFKETVESQDARMAVLVAELKGYFEENGSLPEDLGQFMDNMEEDGSAIPQGEIKSTRDNSGGIFYDPLERKVGFNDSGEQIFLIGERLQKSPVNRKKGAPAKYKD